MTTALNGSVPALPESIDRVLGDFVEAARRSLGPDLVSIVLYGSGAEGKLRASSDVNLLLVLSSFDRAKIDSIREPLRFARSAIRLKAMFLLESEIAPAVTAFAAKFADILRRRRVLHGTDPFETLVVPRGAMIARLQQVLLNLAIRLREMYALRSLREEQLAPIIADYAGPLRAAAATILELEGAGGLPPKEALARLAASVGLADHQKVLSQVSQAREGGRLEPGEASRVLLALGDLATAMRARTERLAP